MKHLKFMLESLPSEKQKFVKISKSSKLFGSGAPSLSLSIQDGKIPGIDASDILSMAKYLIQSIDSKSPNADHKATIINIEEAEYFQDRIKKDEAKKV